MEYKTEKLFGRSSPEEFQKIIEKLTARYSYLEIKLEVLGKDSQGIVYQFEINYR